MNNASIKYFVSFTCISITSAFLFFGAACSLADSDSLASYARDPKTDGFFVSIASSRSPDGTTRPPYLLITEQRSIQGMPVATLSSDALIALHAEMLLTEDSTLSLDGPGADWKVPPSHGQILHIRRVIYQFIPPQSKWKLLPSHFDFLPQQIFPFLGIEIDFPQAKHEQASLTTHK